MIKRIGILTLSLLLFPLAASAQNNELGVFASTTQLDDNEIQNSDVELEFDEDMGIGVMYNRFWFGAFSTELGYQRLGADLTGSLDDVSQDLGELDLDILSATGQLHFARGSMLSPYVGGGLAYISGEAGNIDGNEIETVDLENELEFLVNAGLNIGLGRTFGLFVDGKYIMYEARGEGDSDGEALDLNPLIISAGLKLKF